MPLDVSRKLKGSVDGSKMKAKGMEDLALLLFKQKTFSKMSVGESMHNYNH